MDRCAILNFCLEIVSFLFSYKTSFIHLWLLFLEHLSIFYSSLSSHSLVRTTEHVYTVCTLHKVAQLKVKSTWLKQRSRTSHRAVNGSVSPEEGKEVGRKDPPPQPKGKVKFFPIQSSHSLGAALVLRVTTPTANTSHMFNGAPSLALFEILFPSGPYYRNGVATVRV